MLEEAESELINMVTFALEEGRNFTRDEQLYFDKLFEKTLNEME